MDPITLALMGIQIGSGVWGMLNANKVPPELQEYYDMVKQQAESGLGGDYQAMLNQGAGQIAQQAGAMQARGAAAVASRGMGSSSAADAMIAGVNKTQAEAFGQLQGSLMQLNQQVKARAQAQLGQAGGAIAGLKQEKMTAGAQSILGGLTTGLGYMQNKDQQQMYKDTMTQISDSLTAQRAMPPIENPYGYLTQFLLLNQFPDLFGITAGDLELMKNPMGQ